jgi:hypothetical protein
LIIKNWINLLKLDKKIQDSVIWSLFWLIFFNPYHIYVSNFNLYYILTPIMCNSFNLLKLISPAQHQSPNFGCHTPCTRINKWVNFSTTPPHKPQLQLYYYPLSKKTFITIQMNILMNCKIDPLWNKIARSRTPQFLTELNTFINNKTLSPKKFQHYLLKQSTPPTSYTLSSQKINPILPASNPNHPPHEIMVIPINLEAPL